MQIISFQSSSMRRKQNLEIWLFTFYYLPSHLLSLFLLRLLFLSLGIYWALFRWGKPFHLNFHDNFTCMPSFCLLSPSLNRAHSDMVWKISPPCTCYMTKLSLTVKTDYVTSSTDDLDPHLGRYGRFRSEWVRQLERLH